MIDSRLSSRERAALVPVLVLGLASVLAVSSCRTKQTIAHWQWADVDTLLGNKDKIAAIDDAPAVVLLREQKLLFQIVGNEDRSELHTHEIIQLLTEDGFERAQVRIFWPKKGKLLHLDARTIAPDGTVTLLDAGELFSSEVKLSEKNEIEARFFSFPRVELGSYLELAYTTELPGLYTWWSDRVSDDLPIVEYKVEIAVDDNADPDLRIYNSGVKPVVVQRGSLKHLSFSMHDVPAAVHESYAPSWRTREPWWLYRTISYRYPKGPYYTNFDWDDVTYQVVPLFNGKGLEGTPRADLSGCSGDPICIVTRCNDLVRATTTFTGFDRAFDQRPINAIVADRAASSADKAALLFAVLREAGVDARLAGIARRHTNEVPRDIPSLIWLNHTLVVASFGEQGVLWIDPSCEYCVPGFMPSWVAIGEPALVVSPKDGPGGKKVHEIAWWSVAGQPMPIDDGRTRTFQIAIEDDGDAKLVLDETRTGESALFWKSATRNHDDDDQRRDARAAMLAISRAALLDKFEPITCDRARGHCTRRVEATLPRFAHVGPDEVRVSLAVLSAVFDVIDEEEPRKTDVLVDSAWRSHDEVRLRAPAGKRFAAVPESWQASGPLVDVAVTSSLDGDMLVIKRETKLTPGTIARRDLERLEPVIERGAALTSSVVKLVPAL